MSNIIEEALKKTLTRAVEKPKPGWYYPSLLPSCLLRQYWIYKEGHTVSLEKSGIFKIGELFHGFLTGALKSEGVLKVESEKPITLAVKRGDVWVRISGRVDALVENGEVKMIVEVKSISKLPERPLEHHVMQVQPYMLALGVEKTILVYLEKIDLSWRIFEVSFNSNVFEKMVKRAVMLDEALTEDRALKPEPSWECRYCEFKERCEAGE
jgi:CRISPR/Cas system-associated exonuclease Cas4 (RecB family)